ncbi:MAG TPA: response regulator transcription factor [Rubricoccaceae bacterium]|nr:response regulator transcription factor [Rubricoccaceae bacterium]
MPSPPPPSVWIVEDDEAYRAALQAALAPAADVREVFGSVEDALAWAAVRERAADTDRPDVLLLDVNLPGMSGLDGLGALKARLPGTRVVMLTIRDDAETIYAALGAGASGYLLKNADPDQLAAAVEAARDGGMLMPGPVARKVLAAFDRPRPSPDYGLTERERDVLREMVAGHTQKEIAERLFVSPSTVNTHVQHIYEKLHVHTGSAAVAKAVRERLVDAGGAAQA